MFTLFRLKNTFQKENKYTPHTSFNWMDSRQPTKLK